MTGVVEVAAERLRGATASAVLVPCLPAERAVARHRARFDRAASLGVPAHVTVLYPFVPPDEIDAQVVATLARAIATVRSFDATCETTGWFGEDVLWLDPQPAHRFRALTSAAWEAFPDRPPYRGEYAEVVPHLTVGHGVGVEALRAVEDEVLPRLPVRIPVTSASLWCGTDAPGSWRWVADLRLG